jgi:hypothetical protein
MISDFAKEESVDVNFSLQAWSAVISLMRVQFEQLQQSSGEKTCGNHSKNQAGGNLCSFELQSCSKSNWSMSNRDWACPYK